ncbi:MAG: hypothetical protein Aurels2KO_54980 [Aureliella sp.]
MRHSGTLRPKNGQSDQTKTRGAHRQTAGATIGDGMRTTARWGGALALATLLLKIGPALAAGLFALVFFLRSMMAPANQPLNPNATQHSPQPAYVADTSLPRAPVMQSSYGRLETIPESQSPLNQMVELPTANVGSRNELEGKQHAALRAQFSPPMSIDSMFGALAPHSEMPVLGRQPNAIDPPQTASSVELSTLFESRRGRTLAGTAQMPGSASQRVRLSIDSIRDGGSHIKARLSTLEGRRVTKLFVGYLQSKPDQLVLKPDIPRGNIPMFLTHASWQVCQTAITLEMSPDGQILEGTSVSGEQFRFTPQIHAPPSAQLPAINQAYGFGSATGPVAWNLTSRNASDTTEEVWEFTATDSSKGTFVWKRGQGVHARGSYHEDPGLRTLDITVSVGGQSRIYRGIYSLEHDEASVCLSRQAGGIAPPASLNAASGNLFTLRKE